MELVLKDALDAIKEYNSVVKAFDFGHHATLTQRLVRRQRIGASRDLAGPGDAPQKTSGPLSLLSLLSFPKSSTHGDLNG